MRNGFYDCGNMLPPEEQVRAADGSLGIGAQLIFLIFHDQRFVPLILPFWRACSGNGQAWPDAPS